MFNLTIDKEKKIPVYQQIKQQIVKHINSDKIPADTPLPNIKEIGKIAGVSIRTVDRALNALIDEGICYRQPKKGTFVMDNSCLELFQRQIIGVNCPYQVKNLYTHQVENNVYSGIIEKSGKCDLTPFFIARNLDQHVEFYQRSREVKLLGVILLTELTKKMELMRLKKFSPTRFVLINYDITSYVDALPENVICVLNDDYLGGYQAAEYLINEGHKEFAIMTFDIDNNNYNQRVAGYLQAIRDHGLQFRPELLLNGGKRIKEYNGEMLDYGTELLKNSSVSWINFSLLRAQFGLGGQLYQEAVKTGINFSAIICVNDYLAFGAHQASITNNRTARPIAVAGYDNIIPELSSVVGFPTVAIDFKEMGRRAVSILSTDNEYSSQIMRIIPQLIPKKNKKYTQVKINPNNKD